MRDITVPTGIESIAAISAYENSSTSRNQTAWRNASRQRVDRRLQLRRERVAQAAATRAFRRRRPPTPGAAARRRARPRRCRPRPCRAPDRAPRFRAVLWRIVNNHALRFVPGSNRSAARNAFRYVSCTRSSASAGSARQPQRRPVQAVEATRAPRLRTRRARAATALRDRSATVAASTNAHQRARRGVNPRRRFPLFHVLGRVSPKDGGSRATFGGQSGIGGRRFVQITADQRLQAPRAAQ